MPVNKFINKSLKYRSEENFDCRPGCEDCFLINPTKQYLGLKKISNIFAQEVFFRFQLKPVKHHDYGKTQICNFYQTVTNVILNDQWVMKVKGICRRLCDFHAL